MESYNLEHFSTLHGLGSSLLLALAKLLCHKTYAAGELILSQGSPGEGIFFITAGTVEVESDGVVLASLASGDCVGEIGVLTGATSNASVRAASSVDVLLLTVDDFHLFIQEHPQLRRQLMALAALRQAEIALHESAIFRHLDHDSRRQLANLCSWVDLPGGQPLFQVSDPADELYIVMTGQLIVLSAAGLVVGELGEGDIIGEMSLLTSGVHRRTVMARRDCRLLKLSREAFFSLLEEHPRVLRYVLKEILQRTQEQRHHHRSSAPKTIVIVHAGDRAQPEFVELLEKAFASVGSSEFISSKALGSLLGFSVESAFQDIPRYGRILEWLRSRERLCKYLVLVADPAGSQWSQFCLRQADQVLVIADAQSSRVPGSVEALLSRSTGRSQAVDFVLWHPNAPKVPSAMGPWLENRPWVSRSYHARGRDIKSLERIARLITRCSIGLVLSGGGARGYAHLGVIRALREANIPIDAIGGTSAGAIIGALIAMGLEHDEIIERIRESLRLFKPHRDFTAPVYSLFHREFDRAMEYLFGQRQIEDLWTNFFCITCNLSHADVASHHRGDLWRWVRTSSAVPGLLPPELVGKELHVDGGLVNNLPVDVMRQHIGGSVLAVDVAYSSVLALSSGKPATQPWLAILGVLGPFSALRPVEPTIPAILAQSMTCGSIQHNREMREQADLLFDVSLRDVGLMDFHRDKEIVSLGYQKAQESLATKRAQEFISKLEGARNG